MRLPELSSITVRIRDKLGQTNELTTELEVADPGDNVIALIEILKEQYG